MKKIISVLVIAFMLLVSTNTVLAVDNTLDIEKVAIESIKNSLNVQSLNRQVTGAQKNYADISGMMSGARENIRYPNSYPLVQSIILQPLIFEYHPIKGAKGPNNQSIRKYFNPTTTGGQSEDPAG